MLNLAGLILVTLTYSNLTSVLPLLFQKFTDVGWRSWIKMKVICNLWKQQLDHLTVFMLVENISVLDFKLQFSDVAVSNYYSCVVC